MGKKKATAPIEAIDESPINQEVLLKGQELGLNAQQTLFCVYYSSFDETFGNGAQSYLAVYGAEYLLKNKKAMSFMVAAACASRLLTNVKVLELVNSLIEMRGLNDSFVDKQLEFLVTQHADFKAKLGAIKEYNALKKRTEGPGTQLNIGVIVLPQRNDNTKYTLATTTEAGDSPSEE